MGERGLLTAAEFYSELHQRGLKPTEILTETGRLWVYRDEWYISIPDRADVYPRYVLHRILEHLRWHDDRTKEPV